MFGEKKRTLVVVYKDEMLVNQLKKLVETKDDSEDKVIGTKDDSINIVAWDEKIWLANKKKGTIKGKILFLGGIKDTDKLTPVIDLKFDKYGVKYGWAGNQAILYSDYKGVEGRATYLELINELKDLDVPDMIKTPETFKVEAEIATVGDEQEKSHNEGIKLPSFIKAVKKGIDQGAEGVMKFGQKVVNGAEDLFRNRNAVTRQQLFYGLINLYNNDLEKYMNE